MAIGKPRGANGARPVYVYDSDARRKVYIGSRTKLRGPGGAQELERQAKAEIAARAGSAKPQPLTVAQYADEWLRLHHGDRTRRPSPTTLQVNTANLRVFLQEYGTELLDGGIDRRKALAWARQHPHNAKSVSAMFNDAVDDDVCKANPFANRRHEQPRGRKDIHPLTGEEVDLLASIALRHWGEDGYGLVARAWVLFAAWVGTRPGETFAVTAADLDLARGEASITRVKRRGHDYPTDTVVVPVAACDAIRAMPVLPPAGPVFQTITGKRMVKGALRYHWDPVRSRFREHVTVERWAEVTEGQPDLALYSLRHFCASMLVERGCTEFEVSAQLGNSPEMARQTYIHAYEDRVRDRIRGALNGPGVVDLAAARQKRETA